MRQRRTKGDGDEYAKVVRRSQKIRQRAFDIEVSKLGKRKLNGMSTTIHEVLPTGLMEQN